MSVLDFERRLPAALSKLNQEWQLNPRAKLVAFTAGLFLAGCTQPSSTFNPETAPQAVSNSSTTSATAITPSPVVSSPATPKAAAIAQTVTPDRTAARVVSTGDGDTF
ncbi:hypothetical protein NDI45_27015, partial [Leptolyngbya sp. GB1-A1]